MRARHALLTIRGLARSRGGRRRAARAAAALLALFPLAACNIITPIASVAAGPPTRDAEYRLGDRPTVVFVEDRANVLQRSSLRRVIGEKASEALMENKVVTRTISPQDALALARRETHDQPLAMDEIGRAVGAEQVVFVEMLSFHLSPDGYSPQPAASCRVKVIDVPNRQRLFPGAESDSEWRILNVAAGEAPSSMYRDQAARRRLQDMLADEVGDQVARLFYKHTPREVGERLDPARPR
jgi:hypothetical protein